MPSPATRPDTPLELPCARVGAAARRRVISVSPEVADWGLLILPGLIWGASFLFIAEGLVALGPNGVTFTRIAVGLATLSCVPASRRPVAREDWPRIALLAIVWFALPLSMFPFAEREVSTAVTGMLNGAVPLFAAAFAAVIARRLPSREVGLGLGVGFLGAVLVALPGLGADAGTGRGVLLIFCALVSYGLAVNLARPLQQRNGALPVIWRALGLALLLTAPLGLPDLLDARWSTRPLLAMLALGAFGTGIANVLVTVAAGRLGATRASASTFLIPVVALVLGVVFRREHVAPLSVVGGGVCLAGAWMLRMAALRTRAS